ncbi:hypothetical protein DFH06DRAFT_1149943 [Mycena polygramma]|nr:hypothetical protein DFH06DRAFT_1149943 [Mycena polygramma]
MLEKVATGRQEYEVADEAYECVVLRLSHTDQQELADRTTNETKPRWRHADVAGTVKSGHCQAAAGKSRYQDLSRQWSLRMAEQRPDEQAVVFTAVAARWGGGTALGERRRKVQSSRIKHRRDDPNVQPVQPRQPRHRRARPGSAHRFGRTHKIDFLILSQQLDISLSGKIIIREFNQVFSLWLPDMILVARRTRAERSSGEGEQKATSWKKWLSLDLNLNRLNLG